MTSFFKKGVADLLDRVTNDHIEALFIVDLIICVLALGSSEHWSMSQVVEPTLEDKQVLLISIKNNLQ